MKQTIKKLQITKIEIQDTLIFLMEKQQVKESHIR